MIGLFVVFLVLLIVVLYPSINTSLTKKNLSKDNTNAYSNNLFKGLTKENVDEITIKNLLTSTSGIPNHTEFTDFDKERRVYKYIR